MSYQNGCRHFVSCQPNNYALAMDDIDLAMLAGAGHLLRADVWFSEPMLAGGNETLFREARARGLATSLDINWDPPWGSADAAAIARRKQSVRQILPWVDLAHGNIRELNQFADSNDLDATLQPDHGLGAGAIVVHLGAGGAGYYLGGQLTVVPAAARAAVRKRDRHRRPAERLHDAPARPGRDSAGRPAAPGQRDRGPVH